MSSDRDRSNGRKRARMACVNCRRKKVRCSGRQPTCDFCQRLSQPCHYKAKGESSKSISAPDRSRISIEELGERMNIIEDRLSDIMGLLRGNTSLASPIRSVTSPPSSVGSVCPGEFDVGCLGSSSGKSPVQTTTANILPPPETLLAVADVYFKYCHNQPYGLFHEETFRYKLAAGTLPKHLIFAFLASALRFSSDPCYRDNRFEAIERYASESSKSILLPWNGVENAVDISTVQAILLLSVIDYTNGKCQSAWIKVGLAIRVAQYLQMMKEPDHWLPVIEQEERRRVFWSFYILDKLISCGQEQPSTISEQMCELQLPCDEWAFQKGESQDMPTLDQITSGVINPSCLRPRSSFSRLILLSSAFGQCAQYTLKTYKYPRQLPPWDPQSKFSTIYSLLLKIEQMFSSETPISETIQKEYVTVDEEINHNMAGPMVFAHCLFHLCRCLLHHPFLLNQRLANLDDEQAPLSFLSHALNLYKTHAQALTALMEEVKKIGYMPLASFYGYFNTISGTAHALFAQSDDQKTAKTAEKHFELCMGNLNQLSQHWKHAGLMIPMLKRFQASSVRFKGLINPSQLMHLRLDSSDTALIWETVDNNFLSTSQEQQLLPYPYRQEYDSQQDRNQDPLASSFLSPLLDELFDIYPLNNSGLASPSTLQNPPPLPFGSTTSTSRRGAENIFSNADDIVSNIISASNISQMSSSQPETTVTSLLRQNPNISAMTPRATTSSCYLSADYYQQERQPQGDT